LSYTFFETGIPKPVADSKESKKKASS